MKPSKYLPLLLALSMIVACVETDISVAGFPEMVRYFSTTEAFVQLTMSVNFLGFCLAGLLYGPLSDSFGRRPIMLIGNCIFLLGAIGTATSNSIDSLIAWRFIQGIGASASFTVAFAVIADAYQGETASRLLNRINAGLTAVMAGAPVAGGFLAQAFGWRSTYSSVAVMCLLSTAFLGLFLPETNLKRQVFNPKQIIQGFWRLLTDIDFMSLTIGLTLQCAGYMAFVAGAVFVYVDRFQLSLMEFTFQQACVIAVFSIVSFFGGHINSRIGTRTSMILGLVLNVIGGIGMYSLAQLGVLNAAAFTTAMSIYAVGVALCYGVTFSASMELFPSLKGTAASLNSSIRLLIISLAIWIVGSFANGTFIPETTLIVSSAILAAGMLAYVAVRPRVVLLIS
jgi:DHA1 family bicyclomycin/chloramphenicol resistance-like MFS transporter